MPEVLLAVGTEDFTVVRDKICSVEELEFSLRIFEDIVSRRCVFGGCWVPFYDSPRDDAYLELTCQFAVPVKVYLVL